MKLGRELKERLAAEYALGTLRGAARARLERRRAKDPELAAAIQAWETRLTPMANAVESVAPPARIWSVVEQRIADQATPRFSLWKALGLVASGAVAALIAVAVFLPRLADEASYVAVLSDPKTSQPVLVASADQRGTVLRVNTLDPKIHVAGRSLELWALPRGGNPRSLGIIGTGNRGSLKLVAAADQALGDVPALAISLEPPGGSPTGQPTGPVLYSGPCVKYW